MITRMSITVLGIHRDVRPSSSFENLAKRTAFQKIEQKKTGLQHLVL